MQAQLLRITGPGPGPGSQVSGQHFLVHIAAFETFCSCLPGGSTSDFALTAASEDLWSALESQTVQKHLLRPLRKNPTLWIPRLRLLPDHPPLFGPADLALALALALAFVLPQTHCPTFSLEFLSSGVRVFRYLLHIYLTSEAWTTKTNGLASRQAGQRRGHHIMVMLPRSLTLGHP